MIQALTALSSNPRNSAESLNIGDFDDRDIFSRVIDFVPNAGFLSQTEDNYELVAETRARHVWPEKPVELPAHLLRLCSAELLTQAQESALFKQMNFLKYLASKMRDELDINSPDTASLTKIRSLLNDATAIRDHLIQSNTRLAVSAVKQFVTPQQSFDDLLSDAIYTLMQAVEKFDYDRGFRFSTYAFRSIVRNACRVVKTANKKEARLTRDAEEWAFGESDISRDIRKDQEASKLSAITADLVSKLDRREQLIIRSRYALGIHRKKKTFQHLADKLGVSKERARQLEKRAIEKLRTMAADLSLDEIPGIV